MISWQARRISQQCKKDMWNSGFRSYIEQDRMRELDEQKSVDSCKSKHDKLEKREIVVAPTTGTMAGFLISHNKR